MEAMLEISLYSYLYLKLAKMLWFYYLLCFLFNKIGEKDRRSAWKPGVGGKGRSGGQAGEMAQIMYAHMNK
jgi:hypothetical protein